MFVTDHYRAGNEEIKLAIFSTIAAANPEAATKLIGNFTPEDHKTLSIEVATYRLTHNQQLSADEVEDLMEVVRNRQCDFIRRGKAMEILAKTALNRRMIKEFSQLLIAEVMEPHEGHYGMTTLRSVIVPLSQLPPKPEHIDLIAALDNLGYSDLSPPFGLFSNLLMMPPNAENHEFPAPATLQDH